MSAPDSGRVNVIDLLKVDDERLDVFLEHLHDELFQFIRVVKVHFSVYIYDVDLAPFFLILSSILIAAPFSLRYALIFMMTSVWSSWMLADPVKA